MYKYDELMKVKYKNQIYRIIRRNDNKFGFLKINKNNEYILPSSFEYLKLNSKLSKNRIKF